MSATSKGLTAGLAATFALSAIMVMKSVMGLMPQLDVIALLTQGANNWMGLPATPVVGWIIHFMVGIVLYGLAFAFLHKKLPGNTYTTQGIVLAVIGWLIMMVILMPMMGKGFLGLGIGVTAPIMTFILHIIFGAVLGWTYGKLSHRHREARPAHA
jgi:uncharacterized membrane protein YagU involved in acid resistance